MRLRLTQLTKALNQTQIHPFNLRQAQGNAPHRSAEPGRSLRAPLAYRDPRGGGGLLALALVFGGVFVFKIKKHSL